MIIVALGKLIVLLGKSYFQGTEDCASRYNRSALVLYISLQAELLSETGSLSEIRYLLKFANYIVRQNPIQVIGTLKLCLAYVVIASIGRLKQHFG